MFPAYAGMIPGRTRRNTGGLSVTRIRGDDPTDYDEPDITKIVFPAYAGMIPAATQFTTLQSGVPRIRGDDPDAYGR